MTAGRVAGLVVVVCLLLLGWTWQPGADAPAMSNDVMEVRP